MDFPLIDEKNCNLEEILNPFEDLKLLQRKTEKLRNQLYVATETLNRTFLRQKAFKEEVRNTVDNVMSFGSRFSEHKKARKDLIRKIKEARLREDASLTGDNPDDEDADQDVDDTAVELQVVNFLNDVIEKVCVLEKVAEQECGDQPMTGYTKKSLLKMT